MTNPETSAEPDILDIGRAADHLENYLTLAEQCILHRALRRAVKFACQECGWWNRGDRACCEGCGQEDWRA